MLFFFSSKSSVSVNVVLPDKQHCDLHAGQDLHANFAAGYPTRARFEQIQVSLCIGGTVHKDAQICSEFKLRLSLNYKSVINAAVLCMGW